MSTRMDPGTIAISNVVIEIIIALLVILIPIGIIAGIIVIVTGNGKDKRKKHLHIIWGVVVMITSFVLLLVILSIWGLFRILTNTVGT